MLFEFYVFFSCFFLPLSSLLTWNFFDSWIFLFFISLFMHFRRFLSTFRQRNVFIISFIWQPIEITAKKTHSHTKRSGSVSIYHFLKWFINAQVNLAGRQIRVKCWATRSFSRWLFPLKCSCSLNLKWSDWKSEFRLNYDLFGHIFVGFWKIQRKNLFQVLSLAFESVLITRNGIFFREREKLR